MENEKEICGLCGEKTDVDVNTPAKFREHLTDGGGELHPECWYKVYGKGE